MAGCPLQPGQQKGEEDAAEGSVRTGQAWQVGECQYLATIPAPYHFNLYTNSQQHCICKFEQLDRWTGTDDFACRLLSIMGPSGSGKLMFCHAAAKNGMQSHYHTFVLSTALHILCTSSKLLCYTLQPALAASILTPLVSYGTQTSSSAAGKTTLLNALAGQVPLTKGMSLCGSVTANGVSLQVGLETCMQFNRGHLFSHTMHKFALSPAHHSLLPSIGSHS